MSHIAIKIFFALTCTLFMSAAHSCERPIPSKQHGVIADAKVNDAALACHVDADCTVVKEGCCGCNQGGKQRAITVAGSQAWLSKLSSSCQDQVCPQMISLDKSCKKQKSVCVKEQCELQ